MSAFPFDDGGSGRDQFVQQKAREREERARLREDEARQKQLQAAVILAQSALRRHFAKADTKAMLRAELDAICFVERSIPLRPLVGG
jgi:predicted 2-oxoglutarate/Fe(II)-dependent dioxygenase YbiX